MARRSLNTQEHPLALLDPTTLDQIRVFSGFPEGGATAVAVIPDAWPPAVEGKPRR